MNEIFKGILAGISIGIAGFVNLKVGGGILGAVLFAFGLLAVVSQGLWLFTGMAHKVWRRGHNHLLGVLALNIVGCMAVAAVCSSGPVTESAEAIIAMRLEKGALMCGLLSIGCGFIMTTAVRGAYEGNWWPLLFGVPVFIMCGFPHCVADAFYLSACSPGFLIDNWPGVLLFYISIVPGNYVGCNLWRFTQLSPKSFDKWYG